MSESDHLLIAEFNARRSETAFAALVRQHLGLVFATAFRQVGDVGAAEEITQSVFVALSQSAGKLGSHPTLAGWLHQTALNKSREWLRGELRRRRRERTAVELELAGAAGDSVWSSLVPLLDEALLELREPDRLAVILHFMEGRTFHEVGSTLGVGEDAARKRVNRCLDQLTRFFHRHGFATPALTASAPIFALAAHAVPPGLAMAATTAGLAAPAAGSTIALLKGVLKIMALTKAKVAVSIAAAVLVAGTAAVIVVTGPPTDQTIDAKIARLTKPGTTVKQAIRVLGEPQNFAAGAQILDPRHLPASYQLVYTNGIQVWILDGTVRELESLQPGPGFSYRGKLRLGSTLAEVQAIVGPPSETLSGQAAEPVLGSRLGGFAGVLYQNLDGEPGYGYYWRPDQSVRFILKHDQVTALLLDVPN